jgi:hypothetical protein
MPVLGVVLGLADALLWIGLHVIWLGGYQTTWRVEWMRYNPETTYPILDFNTGGFRPVLFWWRVGVWSGILAIVATSFGKGNVRKWGLMIAVLTFLIWLLRGHS